MKEETAPAALSTVDAGEIAHFSRMAEEWWNPDGPFKPLHRMNPARIEWILDRIQDSGFRIREGITLLDIGCGGGLVCEPFARLGARVTGIDASEKNIAVARLHAEQAGLGIDYRCTTAEALVRNSSSEPRTPNPESYDIVLALEIIEHVADVEAFAAAACALVKPGGLIVMSTLNRTAKAFALAVVGAEYIMRLLPRGTHHWNKFLHPHELVNALRRHGVEVTAMTGLVYQPFTGGWRLDKKDLGVNYIVAGRKT